MLHCRWPVNTLAISHCVLISLVHADVQVTSSQIDRHPTIFAEEGQNVSITCAKTAGTESDWKFRILQDDMDPLELLYSKNLTQLEQEGIHTITEESSSISESSGLENFTLVLINVKINMTGIAIVCGARGGKIFRDNRSKFYDHAAILIINEGKNQIITVWCIYNIVYS